MCLRVSVSQLPIPNTDTQKSSLGCRASYVLEDIYSTLRAKRLMLIGGQIHDVEGQNMLEASYSKHK